MRGHLAAALGLALVATIGGGANSAVAAPAGTKVVAVPLALAQEIDRVQVGLPGRNTTRGFSSATYLTAHAPEGYRRASEGRMLKWVGPTCVPPTMPQFAAELAITWGIGFDNGVRTAEQAAEKARTFSDWTVVERSAIAIPHVIRGREVGKLPGFYVIGAAREEGGWHEGGLGISMSRGVFALGEFWSRANTFRCIVNGVESRAWHLDATRRAIAAIAVDGNLPPARVTARARGRRVAGQVTDGFGHPVAGVRVTFERRVGRTWRRAGAGASDALGRYDARPRQSGTIRAVVTFGVTVRSGPVRVR